MKDDTQRLSPHPGIPVRTPVPDATDSGVDWCTPTTVIFWGTTTKNKKSRSLTHSKFFLSVNKSQHLLENSNPSWSDFVSLTRWWTRDLSVVRTGNDSPKEQILNNHHLSETSMVQLFDVNVKKSTGRALFQRKHTPNLERSREVNFWILYQQHQETAQSWRRCQELRRECVGTHLVGASFTDMHPAHKSPPDMSFTVSKTTNPLVSQRVRKSDFVLWFHCVSRVCTRVYMSVYLSVYIWCDIHQ